MYSIYSSVEYSPMYSATFFNSSTVNFPTPLISNDLNTFSTSVLASFLSLAVENLKNSLKSIPPDWSSSNSAKTWYTNLFFPNPRLSKAFFNYRGFMTPLWSASKMSKAILIYLTSSIGVDKETKSSAFHYFFYRALDSYLRWDSFSF